MAEPTAKQIRIIDRALTCLFSPRSIVALESIRDLEKFDKRTLLSRMLRLDDKRTLFLSDWGLEQLRRIALVVVKSNIFEGRVAHSDILTAVHHLVENCFLMEARPDDGHEFLALLRASLGAEIVKYTFAVPLFGVAVSRNSVLSLGSMRLAFSPMPSMNADRVRFEIEDPSGPTSVRNLTPWLIGSAMGTSRVARQRFQEAASLAVGMLAISAASMYDRGASAFRIGLMMSTEAVHGPATWFSWTDRDSRLITHRHIGGRQLFEPDRDLTEDLPAAHVLPTAFAIMESESRSELEDAIRRAVFWYSDAHRDPVHVMKFIKYWSCVETFFSTSTEQITESSCLGLASVLVYGPYGFVPEADFISVHRRAVKLYSLRSSAVHRARYGHISDPDVDILSQWTAWLVINMIDLTGSGYTALEEVKTRFIRLGQRALGAAGAKDTRVPPPQRPIIGDDDAPSGTSED